MAEIRKNDGTKDYKERFEFRLTVGDNIICQRYFRIGGFNYETLKSFELADTIRRCGQIIDDDLKSKTAIYLDIYAPQVFETVEEMERYFSVEENCQRMCLGTGITIRDPKAPNYVWGKNGVEPLNEKFDEEGEFSSELTADDFVEYKFAFYDNAALTDEGNIIMTTDDNGLRTPLLNFKKPREVCSTVWTGIYPKYVRSSIDLSNKRGRLYDDDDITRLSLDRYLLYKMVEGRTDLVYTIIKEICNTCSTDSENLTKSYDEYTTDAYIESEACKSFGAIKG